MRTITLWLTIWITWEPLTVVDLREPPSDPPKPAFESELIDVYESEYMEEFRKYEQAALEAEALWLESL